MAHFNQGGRDTDAGREAACWDLAGFGVDRDAAVGSVQREPDAFRGRSPGGAPMAGPPGCRRGREFL